ncbi:MAG: hypothetical protein ACMX3H_09825, partial [Sodalis sp. (in: enterobacteria)]|uniref:hypothetical protein n=1 Tax=Sodalis sp. (in: enterobacteria) TaxID=1898979 RepID=UPI0039E38A5D
MLPHNTMVLCHKVTYVIYNFPLKAPAADTGRAPAQDAAIKNVRDVPSRVDVKTLEVSYYDELEATFGSRHGRLKSQRMTYTGEPEKTVVSKDYFWEKRTARDNIPTDYELVCTCHFSVNRTRPDLMAAPETAAVVWGGNHFRTLKGNVGLAGSLLLARLTAILRILDSSQKNERKMSFLHY